ncbi:MAG: transcription-repair coupling factor, partial [Bacteroidetes bacterium]|nr:transcription-repair coupling factor [Bacteroidota bacterium]
HELLEDDMDRFQISVKLESLHEGFELPSLGLAVYTDHQIFNRYHRPSARRQKKRFGGLSLRELHQLVPGDFVVHIDHGIGRFSGMQKITVRGKRQEVARIDYLNDDVLYVNVNALHKLHKYKGKEGHQPKLTRLGSGQWERAKSRTKSRVKDIARDLIKLYARRKASEGYAFSEDSVWQRELEASFLFEDTPDQAAASQAVKEDMRRSTPMDRLVCGDVGFGKTEIAIRAAFKAVQDGKQVAVLVPTTVLAMQHERTFTDRLSTYPVNVEVLSRFRSAAQIQETISRIASGAADVIIGTHRLISKDVRFKDLGLLIIDEEQRFGVSVKEKLRRMRVNVDTLTLTATPIPRTLQFSLLGARDFSIMATAPPNRQPIVTEIHTFDKDLIRDAILLEVNRGGQVFFIHNRVQSIMEISEMIRMLIPDVRVQVGHGQMKGSDLERVMIGFFEYKFDVLVCTNIIENGLDVSNANTIIINRADYFGLSELHQLRGRVGRSARKAFCFLLVPSIHGLTREARQRLQAVEEFTDLGSGFHIAMQDLDIRGAGNLLGSEQSGFIEDVGFETYHRILDEAVQELRAEEFSDLFDENKAPVAKETSIDVEADAFIPQTYLANRIERLNLYRRIADARNAEALDSVRAEMADRFGPVPEEVENLLLSVEIKLLGQNLRLSRVVFKNHRLFLVFPTAEADAYFFEHLFHGILERLNGQDRIYALKENSAKKLRAIVQNVPDLDTARDVLLSLQVKTGD